MFGFSKNLQGKVYLTRGLVAARYRRNPRTISRWQLDPRIGFPPPDVLIHDKGYWAPETLDAFDAQQRAAERDSAA